MNSNHNLHGIVPLLGSFDYYHHYILRFPLYGPSLYQFLKDLNYRGLSLDIVHIIANQVYQVFNFIHQ